MGGSAAVPTGTHPSEAERFPQGDVADFPRGEFERRWTILNGGMAAAGIDALLLTSEANYRYVAGHSTQFWVSKTRHMIALLPRDAEPQIFVTPNQAIQARRSSHVRAIHACGGPSAEMLAHVADVIRALAALKPGRFVLGMELGEEQRLGLSLNEFERLRERLAPAHIADASGVLWQARSVKSEPEIGYLRKSARVVGQAYADAFARVTRGMSERDAYREFMVALFTHGAERPGYVPVTSGAVNYLNRTGGPTDRILREGDLLWFDGGCLIGGYWSDSARMVAIGRATDHQKSCYRAVRDVTHECLARVRPGVPVKDLAAFCDQALGDRGYALKSAGRVGHGIGLDLTEPPSLAASDKTLLLPGMVITVEPTFVDEDGLYQLEEICVVTPDGHELLTLPTPPELQELG